MSKRIRVAVVGCGALAQAVHLPNCQTNPRIELVATCDINREAAEKCQKRYGAARAEMDWKKIIEAPDVDLCVLATHHDFRGEFIVPALKAGKPVYAEKPLSARREEMAEIVRASRKTNRPVCIGHNRRSSPAIMEVKRLLEKCAQVKDVLPPSVDRSQGRIILPEEKYTQILMRINDDIRTWKPWGVTDPEGILLSEMVHFVDLAMWFNPSPVVRVFADGSCRGNFVLVLRFADGSLTTIQHSLVGHFDYPKELFEVTLRNVTIAMDQHLEVRQFGLPDEPVQRYFGFECDSNESKSAGMAEYYENLKKQLERAGGRESARIQRLNVDKGHAAHLDRFVTHVEGNGPNPCDIESAAAVTSVTFKLLQSIRQGIPVPVNPEDLHFC
jgi:predicted dehydrogenase